MLTEDAQQRVVVAGPDMRPARIGGVRIGFAAYRLVVVAPGLGCMPKQWQLRQVVLHARQ
ncbi:hypothetical protein D3C75_1117680 [compost metagenome]